VVAVVAVVLLVGERAESAEPTAGSGESSNEKCLEVVAVADGSFGRGYCGVRIGVSGSSCSLV